LAQAHQFYSFPRKETSLEQGNYSKHVKTKYNTTLKLSHKKPCLPSTLEGIGLPAAKLLRATHKHSHVNSMGENSA